MDGPRYVLSASINKYFALYKEVHADLQHQTELSLPEQAQWRPYNVRLLQVENQICPTTENDLALMNCWQQSLCLLIVQVCMVQGKHEKQLIGCWSMIFTCLEH